MRQLTITRKKTFVACLGRMKVYIEDAASGDTVINGVRCRKLGELKNGETQAFEIGDDELKLFVIADKLSKSFCNEFYRIPAGKKDISLSGKNRFNPASGNAFRFDGNSDAEVSNNRKKTTLKGLIVLLAAAVVGFMLGIAIYSVISDTIGNGKAEQSGTADTSEKVVISLTPKDFSAPGFEITLTESFEQKEVEGFHTSFESPEALVLVSKKAKDEVEEECNSAKDFADYLIDLNRVDIPDGIATNDDGSVSFKYEAHNPNEATEYVHSIHIYMVEDTFWMIQFAVDWKDYDRYLPEYAKWLDSITFTE
jgi:hypothetical protein